MAEAKRIKHNAECERSRFLKELKTLKQRTSQLRCQIGELVTLSERMEMEKKRCGQLQRRLECCDTRVVELEERLCCKTQEVDLARQTYRMLRKDLAQFNRNLNSDESSCSATSVKGRRRGGDVLLQQLKTNDENTVRAKRRKTTDKERQKGRGKEEVEEAGEEGRRDGERGKGGGECDCDKEDIERREERNLPLRNCSSYIVVNECESKFKSCLDVTQPTSSAIQSIKKSSCLTSIRISEVHPRGHYIRIVNASQSQEEDLGNHFLLQRYQDTPFAVFRFPSCVCLPPLGVTTVWSASGAAEEVCAGRQLPSTDFIFSSQPIWASGPDCITILCKPNEQALKWLSSSPSLSKRSGVSGLAPSSLKKHNSLQQQQHQTKSYIAFPSGEGQSTSVKAEPNVEEDCQPKDSRWKGRVEEGRARGEWKRERAKEEWRQTSDSSPDRRTLVQRKKGVTADKEKKEDLERRRKEGEARKRKKVEVREEQRKVEEEKECRGCEEEIRMSTRRQEEEEKRTKKQTDKDKAEDCWKVAAIMDKKIPCTIVHIEDQPISSAVAFERKVNDGEGRGGRGECDVDDDDEQSDCGEGSRDCAEANRTKSIGNNFNSLITSKNLKVAMSDSSHDDSDCCGRGNESTRQKKPSHGSQVRCIQSKDGSLKGGSASRMNECKDRKESRSREGRGGRGGGARNIRGGCCEEEEEEEDDCGGKRKESMSPRRKSNCEECVDSRRKEEEESVQEKWNRPTGRGGGGGGQRGGEGGGGCGGGAKRRTKEWINYEEECCGSGKEGSWSRWTKWLSGLVSGPSREKDSNCGGDRPTFSPSSINCIEQRSVSDAEVHCRDQFVVREICPTYRPRQPSGVQCRCAVGCPPCPPRKADCNEEVGITERTRQLTMMLKRNEGERNECNCDGAQQKREAAKRNGAGGGIDTSRSEGCLQEASATGVCGCLCHLDSMALTAASVVAAGLTVAAIYCN